MKELAEKGQGDIRPAFSCSYDDPFSSAPSPLIPKGDLLALLVLGRNIAFNPNNVLSVGNGL